MRQEGFTLVELLITLAILAILAAIGIPQYLGIMERARLGADRVTIATVQSAVDAFWAEAAENALDQGTEMLLNRPSELQATSLITRETITLVDFLGSDSFPDLQSKAFAGDSTSWVINSEGKLFVRNGDRDFPHDFKTESESGSVTNGKQ